MKHIAAIILAAGSAKRFGGNKLLEPLTLDETTMPMLAHSIKPWLLVFEHVNVVINAESETLVKLVSKSLPEVAQQVRWLLCENAHIGMGISLSLGVRLNAEADGWLIGLGDMPLIPAPVINDVKQALIDGAVIAAPYHHKQRGHPVGLSAKYHNELIHLQQDSGAKEILARDHAAITHIVYDQIGIQTSIQTGIFVDIDTKEDLAQKF